MDAFTWVEFTGTGKLRQFHEEREDATNHCSPHDRVCNELARAEPMDDSWGGAHCMKRRELISLVGNIRKAALSPLADR